MMTGGVFTPRIHLDLDMDTFYSYLFLIITHYIVYFISFLSFPLVHYASEEEY